MSGSAPRQRPGQTAVGAEVADAYRLPPERLVVTPLGVGARTLHERWTAGASGIEDGEGACTEFEPTEHLSVKEVRRADRFTQFALVSSDEAIAEAGWDGELPYDPKRVGSIIGTGIGGIETTRRITAADAGVLVVLVSSYSEHDLPADACTSGAASAWP